jgi:hypothetical protein
MIISNISNYSELENGIENKKEDRNYYQNNNNEIKTRTEHVSNYIRHEREYNS